MATELFLSLLKAERESERQRVARAEREAWARHKANARDHDPELARKMEATDARLKQVATELGNALNAMPFMGVSSGEQSVSKPFAGSGRPIERDEELQQLELRIAWLPVKLQAQLIGELTKARAQKRQFPEPPLPPEM